MGKASGLRIRNVITPDEEANVRFLFENWENGIPEVPWRDLPSVKKKRDESFVTMMPRLDILGATVKGGGSNVTVQIAPTIVDLVSQLDNPPLRDYWRELGEWFRSRPWSIPVFVFLVATPLIAQWVELLANVVKFFED